LFIMNDRADLAALADADGVHVGQNELAVGEARSILGAGKLVGVSTHTAAQLEQALQDGADYVGCGPTFSSRTKDFAALAGLDFLRAVANWTALPAFAIGGITLQNVSQVLETGFRRVAVRSAVWNADDPAAAAQELLAILEQGDRHPDQHA
jgi:thiamine-phosphate pyrophosphorylase